MTDPGTADRTYIGPMTPELVEQIIAKVTFTGPYHSLFTEQYAVFACRPLTCLCGLSHLTALCAMQERPEAILPTMGGQTGLNLAKALSEVSHQFLPYI